MTPTSMFAKAHYELLELGLPRTLVVLYGVLEHMVGKNSDCWPTQSTLAKMIGLKVTKKKRSDQENQSRQVQYLLHQLRALKLIEWKRTRYYCRYRVLRPDMQWIAYLKQQTRSGAHISDTQSSAYRKEPGLKEPQRPPASQPASGSGGNTAKAGRLAEIAKVITKAWSHLPGRIGDKKLAEIGAILGDIPLAEYDALLRSKARKVESFGLAASLARDLRDRRNGDARAREQHAGNKRDREDAQLDEQIKKLESMRDDPRHAHDRTEIESMLADLKRTPKSETRARRGAA